MNEPDLRPRTVAGAAEVLDLPVGSALIGSNGILAELKCDYYIVGDFRLLTFKGARDLDDMGTGFYPAAVLYTLPTLEEQNEHNAVIWESGVDRLWAENTEAETVLVDCVDTSPVVTEAGYDYARNWCNPFRPRQSTLPLDGEPTEPATTLDI